MTASGQQIDISELSGRADDLFRRVQQLKEHL
jgi:hypothetical protein